MDFSRLLEKYSLTDFPAGLGGCQNRGFSYDCCEHDISVFDEKKEPDTIAEFEGALVRIHHCSLSETSSKALVQFSGMKVIWDEKWELRMLLAGIEEKRDRIYGDYMRNCLIDSLFCITKSREASRASDPFASCWIKCAAFYLADAILLHAKMPPSAAHFLQYIRSIGKNKVSEKFSVVNECIGIERSAPVLLARMCASTVGFSDMVEGNGHSKIIRAKGDYFLKNALLADGYFYLGRVNRDNIIKIKDTVAKKPELIHVIRVALDMENDLSVIGRRADALDGAAGEILSSI